MWINEHEQLLIVLRQNFLQHNHCQICGSTFSPASITPPVLHVNKQLHVDLTRRSDGQSSRKKYFFGNRGPLFWLCSVCCFIQCQLILKTRKTKQLPSSRARNSPVSGPRFAPGWRFVIWHELRRRHVALRYWRILYHGLSIYHGLLVLGTFSEWAVSMF